jgi:hypothetical protein
MNQYTFITEKSKREGKCYGVVVCKDREAVHTFAQEMVEQEGWEFHKQSWTLHKEGNASLRLLTEEMTLAKYGMIQGMHIVCAFVLKGVNVWEFVSYIFARMRHPDIDVDRCVYVVYGYGLVHKISIETEMWL